MKKLLTITIAVALCLVIAIPALADDVTTTLTLGNGGTSDGPIIYGQWQLQVETLPNFDLTNPTTSGWQDLFDCADEWGIAPETVGTGDSDPIASNCQILPTESTFDSTTGVTTVGESYVAFFAVVEKADMGTPASGTLWTGVHLNVYHPEDVMNVGNLGTDLPADKDPWCGSHKFQHWMYPLGQACASSAALMTTMVNTANTMDILQANQKTDTPTDWTANEIISVVEQGNADIYVTFGTIHNHQPAGLYPTYVSATNLSSEVQPFISAETLDVEELKAYALDFNAINYGTDVQIGVWNQLEGDGFGHTNSDPFPMSTPQMPTVWNTGNVFIQMQVAQDDMTFGIADVKFGARVGSAATSGDPIYYDAACMASEDLAAAIANDTSLISLVPGAPLVMCVPTKFDFYIKPTKDPYPNDPDHIFAGNMILDATRVDYDTCP